MAGTCAICRDEENPTQNQPGQDRPGGCRHFACASCWGSWNAMQEANCTSTKCPSCNLIIVERHGATPGATPVLYNPTSQDEDLDTDDPEVDWDNVDWDWDCATDDDDDFIATDDDLDIASGDSDDGWSSERGSSDSTDSSDSDSGPTWTDSGDELI
jgi:hypothetical protein